MEILKGKGAVVTGAASGIGKAIATAFVEAGTSVLLCDVNEKGLDAECSCRPQAHAAYRMASQFRRVGSRNPWRT